MAMSARLRGECDEFGEFFPATRAFVETAVDEILSKRMIKKQLTRWNRWTVQPFPDIRVAVLKKTLAGPFRRLYPDFQPDNENYPVRLSA
jgi:hypothetical protein